MDESEVNRLCEELSALIELEGGVNPDALGRARWAIAALKSTTQPGDYIDQKLIGLARRFAQWFSTDQWNRQEDGGLFVKECLENDLICIRASLWRKLND